MKGLPLSIFIKNTIEKIITRLSLSEREEKRTTLGIKKANNRVFSFLKYLFTQRKVKNIKNYKELKSTKTSLISKNKEGISQKFSLQCPIQF